MALSCFRCCGVFRLSDAVRFYFLGLGVFGFLALGWFVFLGFCRVLPVCTVSILRVFIFFGRWLIVRLCFSVSLIFIFLKALG